MITLSAFALLMCPPQEEPSTITVGRFEGRLGVIASSAEAAKVYLSIGDTGVDGEYQVVPLEGGKYWIQDARTGLGGVSSKTRPELLSALELDENWTSIQLSETKLRQLFSPAEYSIRESTKGINATFDTVSIHAILLDLLAANGYRYSVGIGVKGSVTFHGDAARSKIVGMCLRQVGAVFFRQNKSIAILAHGGLSGLENGYEITPDTRL